MNEHLHARRVIYEPPVVQLTNDMLLTSVHLLFIGTTSLSFLFFENGEPASISIKELTYNNSNKKV